MLHPNTYLKLSTVTVQSAARNGVLVEYMDCYVHLPVDDVNSIHATALMTICQVKMTMMTVMTISLGYVDVMKTLPAAFDACWFGR